MSKNLDYKNTYLVNIFEVLWLFGFNQKKIILVSII